MTPEAVLSGVVELTREALDARTEATAAEAIVRIAGALIGADQGALGVVRDGEVITVAAMMPPRQPVGSHFPVGFGVAGWVAATGRPAEIQDVRLDKRYVALPYPEVRSFVGVPLQHGEELLGVLSLAAWRPGAFDPHTAEALAPYAQAAAALLAAAARREQMHSRLAALEHETGEGLAESLHELKAPLHSAAGFLELVATEQAGPLNEQQKDFLDTARGECARLKDALATLVEEGAAAAHRPLQLKTVHPHEIVSACVERARGQAIKHQIQLVMHVDPAAEPVEADRAALLQVLGNFVQNGLRYAPRGSEMVVAAVASEDGTQFRVADRGPGVPEYELASIFERFSQSSNVMREPGQVGLGLAISRRIVEQHGGKIWAENGREGGARFCFSLPRAA